MTQLLRTPRSLKQALSAAQVRALVAELALVNDPNLDSASRKKFLSTFRRLVSAGSAHIRRAGLSFSAFKEVDVVDIFQGKLIPVGAAYNNRAKVPAFVLRSIRERIEGKLSCQLAPGIAGLNEAERNYYVEKIILPFLQPLTPFCQYNHEDPMSSTRAAGRVEHVINIRGEAIVHIVEVKQSVNVDSTAQLYAELATALEMNAAEGLEFPAYGMLTDLSSWTPCVVTRDQGILKFYKWNATSSTQTLQASPGCDHAIAEACCTIFGMLLMAFDKAIDAFIIGYQNSQANSELSPLEREAETEAGQVWREIKAAIGPAIAFCRSACDETTADQAWNNLNHVCKEVGQKIFSDPQSRILTFQEAFEEATRL